MSARRGSFRRFCHTAIGGRLVDVSTHVDADRTYQPTQQERNSPGPRFHRCRRDDGREQGRHSGAQQQAADHAALLKAAIEATSIRGRPLHDERGRAAPFASGREALHQSRENEQDRSHHADGGIGRDQTDQDRSDRHEQDGQDQRDLSAFRIADSADDDAAKGTHDETHAERGEGREQRGNVVSGRKEVLGDDRRQVSVDCKVVPLEHVADDSRRDGSPAIGECLVAHRIPRCGTVCVPSRNQLSASTLLNAVLVLHGRFGRTTNARRLDIDLGQCAGTSPATGE